MINQIIIIVNISYTTPGLDLKNTIAKINIWQPVE